MKCWYVWVKTATLLDGKLYQKTSSMLYVDCNNGYAVFILKMSNDMKMVRAAPGVQMCVIQAPNNQNILIVQ